ncbi:MAG: putative metal-dependent phosphoesterase family [Frankiales bacterium]|nr:putative metal-dependent phosphoesterase family [Frankiales bacterium]
MAAAAAARLDVVALTDHDTTAGWEEAALAGGVTLVRGAELSCRHDGISLHLLAYLFDPSDAPLSDVMRALRDSRVGRAERMVQLLVDDGHPVTWDQVRSLAGGTVGRPHIGQALIDHGLVGSLDEAFGPDWIGTGGRYWSGKRELDVVEAIGLVKAAGGVTVFAHPAAAARGQVVPESAIAELAAAGLDGLEVAHPDHPPATQARMADLARDLGLVVTGSSDFHGSNKDVPLGAYLTAAEALEQLVDRATGVPVLHQA